MRFKPKPAMPHAETGARTRRHAPANGNRTGRLNMIATIVAAIVVILWMFSD